MRARKQLLVSVCLAAAAAAFGACSGSGGSGSGALSIAPATSTTSSITTPAAVPVGSGTTAALPPLLAGAVRIDITPPIGVPLAGYGGGQRRHPVPNLNPFSFDHFLMPSTGVRDPINARALFVSDGKN